jgi:predicted XRE-type DNA-binding protein
MIELRRRLELRGGTQAGAAKLLGVSQPRVNDLMRDRINRFSVDTLIKLLGKLGVEVRVTLRAGRAAGRSAGFAAVLTRRHSNAEVRHG